MLVNRVARWGSGTCSGRRRRWSLAVAMDPTTLVRESTARVMRSPVHVQVDQAAVERLADKLVRCGLEGMDGVAMRMTFGGWQGLRLQQEERGFVTWDSGDFHYFEDVEQDGPLTCQYVFVMDALNFCFWPTDK
jgi:hypothetical protein